MMRDEDRALDEIFAAPREKFVAVRDAWAKKLRDEGHKEEAARVKAARRPTVAAWILNQVAREHRADLDALAKAGAALGAAQRRGDRDELRRASEDVRARVKALLQRAREVLGKTPAPSLGRALGQALHRAAAGEAIDELRAGRLEREPSGATGFEAVGTPLPAPKKKKPAPPKHDEKRDEERRRAREEDEQRKRNRERRREHERLSHELDRAKKRAERVRREADESERAAADAERALAALERKFREFT